jgi:hypothetical protein
MKILKINWYTANIIYNLMARKTDVGHAGKTVLYVRILLNQHLSKIAKVIKDEVLLTVSCPIFPSILIAKNLLTGSLKNKSIDNLETQKKSFSRKNSQFFDYLLYAKSK